MTSAPHRTRRRNRRGFALLTVLWVVTAASLLALAAGVAARESIGSAANRAALHTAGWHAEDCAERARLVIEHALRGPDLQAWIRADDVIHDAPLLRERQCTVFLEPAGARLDVNEVSADLARALLLRRTQSPQLADSLVSALLDWRDADDVPREAGAERAWYAARGRTGPRNGPIADVREVRHIRGFESLSWLDSIFTVEPGRLLLTRAPLEVLAALPGMSDELVMIISRARERQAAVDLLSSAAELSPWARERLMRHYAELAPLIAAEPEAWVLRSYGRSRGSAVLAVLELRLVRAQTRAAIVRRRTWAG